MLWDMGLYLITLVNFLSFKVKSHQIIIINHTEVSIADINFAHSGVPHMRWKWFPFYVSATFNICPINTAICN